MRPLFLLTTWFLFLFSSFHVSSSSSSSGHLCLEDQSSALLEWKQNLSISEYASRFVFSSYSKVMSWKPDTDCCSWDGISCQRETGHVIGINLSSSLLYGNIDSNSSLFRLHYLHTLNLADNNFNYSQIPSAFDQLTKLTYLNLSYSMFSGQVPLQISQLVKLVSLDLSSNFELKIINPNLRTLTQNLFSLRELHLSGVDMSAGVNKDWCQALSFAIPDLRVLSLSDCSLSGPIDDSILNLRFLSELYLDSNNISSRKPDFSGNLTSLGTLPNAIGNLKFLTRLNLHNCNFSGLIPPWLANLTQLVALDLSSNNFEGAIRTSLLFLPSLQYFNLGANRLTTIIEDFHHANSSFSLLQKVYLNENQLKGAIPRSVFLLKCLEILDLSSNDFNGTLDFNMLQNLKNLSILDLSYNSLFLSNNSGGNFTSPQLQSFYATSCNFHKFPFFLEHQNNLLNLDISNNQIYGKLPIFLKNQNNLESIDLSNNQIYGKIPKWIWKSHTSKLNLSNNLMSGLELPVPDLPNINYQFIDLHSNKIEEEISMVNTLEDDSNNIMSNILGNLTSYLTNAVIFTISSNKLTGKIPPSICNTSYIEILDLSNNQLSGQIPECSNNFGQSLYMLNLGENKFSGTIPQTFVNGSNLRWVKMNNNQLKGKIPRSLANCKSLEVLDLGNNQITDTFPFWLENLTSLQVLVLRSNKFHGSISGPTTSHAFPMLHIIDLSFNNFAGSLPSKYFHCWKGMKMTHNDLRKLQYLGDELKSFVGGDYYQVTITSKGRDMEYQSLITTFTTIDLSYNSFQGEIPKVIGELTAVMVLNLSGNHLTGKIPSSLGQLTRLESLDLSWNQLSGEIPPQLTNLTFLSILNLAQNHLVGSIPRGKQFDTFENTSYKGNLGLCGFPLSRRCGTTDPTSVPTSKPPKQNQDSTSLLDWKFVLMGYACGVIIGVIIGGLVPSWRIRVFFRMTLRSRDHKSTKGSRRRR